jgi:MFS family permease
MDVIYVEEKVVTKQGTSRAWAVFVGVCFMQMAGLGSVLNSASAFFTQVPAATGIGMGTFALWLTGYGICAFLVMPLASSLYIKYDAKPVISVACIVSALALVGFSFATQAWQFIALGCVMGFSGGCYFLYAAPILINAWFVKKRGLVLGLANIFSGIGGAIWPILFSSLFPLMGYQNVYLVNALIVVVCILPFSLTVFSIRPEKKGYLPYGADEKDGETTNATPSNGVPMKTAVKSVAFILGIIGCALCAFYGGYNAFMQLFTINRLGADFAVTSAYMMTALQFGYIIATPIAGGLTDKFGAKPVGIGLLVVMCAAYVGFLFLQSFTGLLIAAFFFGMNNTLITVFVPQFVRDMFGSKDYEKILSYFMMAVGLVGCFGSTIIGFIFDATMTYEPSFYVGIAVAVVIVICITAARAVSKKLHWEE